MYSETTYTVTNSGLSGGDAAVFGTIVMVMLIFGLVAYAISSYIMSRIFKKAGVEAWKAWVPVYNTWTMLEMGDQKGFWAVLMFIPVVNFASIIFYFLAMHSIGKKLGKEDWFVLLAIFLAPVWMIWLAFDKSVWNGGVSATAVNANVPPAYTPPTPVENTLNEPQVVPTVQPTYNAEPVSPVINQTVPKIEEPTEPVMEDVEQPPVEQIQPEENNQPPTVPPTNNFNQY